MFCKEIDWLVWYSSLKKLYEEENNWGVECDIGVDKCFMKKIIEECDEDQILYIHSWR